MERTYNSKGNMYWRSNMYWCKGIGPYMNTRFEIWEKNYMGWSLRCWHSNFEFGLEHWEEIKNESIQDCRLPWIDWTMDSDSFVI